MKFAGILAISLAVAAAPASRDAVAQGYPSAPVRIIAGFTPGGPGDVCTRGVAQALSQVLGQPFVVENRPGADGIIAMDACVRSVPDGSTLCSVDSYAITLNPVVRTKLSYEPQRDVVPIVQFGALGSALSVHPSLPVNSIRELFELAKAKPNSITFGSFGLASANHLYIEWLKRAKAIEFVEVPYKTASQAMQGLLADQIQVTAFSVGQSAGHAKAGKIRIIAVAGDERSSVYPDAPSFKEAGMEISVLTWFGMFAPAGTPREVVQKLNSEASKLLSSQQFRDKFLTQQGIEVKGPAGKSPEAFAAYMRTEREMYASLVKVIGLKLD
jgi:tripartite-type tricarboxylate transporter receptor subunit TctC